ncbi:MAG: tripartite tricarboxylate transporter TctB family protein [Clostridiales bacterium]|nr:tripartite tricarboxylate transporter TctB family protein [Clostridiales bacterium]
MKFKIRTYLWSGIIMGLASLILLIMLPSQVREPAYDSGAPSPRIIPGICLVIMLIFSVVLLVQSLVFKKEKIVEFDWQKERPAIILIAMLCVYVVLIIQIGYVPASIITFIAIVFFCGERKWPVYVYIVIASILIYLMFKNIFNIPLPTGELFGG